MFGRFVERAVVLLAFLAALGSISGCAQAKADLFGKVTFNGKPVTSGTVQAFLPDGSTRTTEISTDGDYRLTGLPVGVVKFGVVSPHPRKQYESLRAAARTEQQRSTISQPPQSLVDSWVALPDALSRPETSGLSASAVAGVAQHDLALTGTSPAPPDAALAPMIGSKGKKK